MICGTGFVVPEAGYVFARMINVRFDFDVVFSTAWEFMEGLGVRAYHGWKLENVANYSDQIEAYAMQRMLVEYASAHS